MLSQHQMCLISDVASTPLKVTIIASESERKMAALVIHGSLGGGHGRRYKLLSASTSCKPGRNRDLPTTCPLGDWI